MGQIFAGHPRGGNFYGAPFTVSDFSHVPSAEDMIGEWFDNRSANRVIYHR